MAGTSDVAQNLPAYWDEFYRSEATNLAAPSQFAVFCHGELPVGPPIVDIGCGSGRDALFFASQGRRVTGVDQSLAAIEHCRVQAAKNRLPASFVCSEISDADLTAQINRTNSDVKGGSHVYARFFVHAINEEAEQHFLSTAALLCNNAGLLAVEFRTLRDAMQTKMTGAHYRRFIDPLVFSHVASGHGFRLDYFVEGFGYAKYGSDDAHVARCILSRPPTDDVELSQAGKASLA